MSFSQEKQKIRFFPFFWWLGLKKLPFLRSVGDAAGDPDADGLSNLQEFQATTDPKDAAARTKPKFHFAYIVRATVPGSYTVPAAVVEDMYAPRVRARTGMGQMTIGAP